MTNPFLIGQKVYLRAPEPGDEEIYAFSQNHPEPRESLFYALPTSLSENLEEIKKNANDPNTIEFTICTKNPDKAVGNTALFRIDWVGRMAIFYIAIAEPENWSKGYGHETTQLVTDYAFDTLNLNRLQLHVYTGNQRAVKVYQKVGFRIEGTLKQAMYHKGDYCDFYVMGILCRDWKKAKIKK
jgi:RimJ/RimL family protein N-acetyltransferase